jgi:hypothetical protein
MTDRAILEFHKAMQDHIRQASIEIKKLAIEILSIPDRKMRASGYGSDLSDREARARIEELRKELQDLGVSAEDIEGSAAPTDDPINPAIVPFAK